MNRKWPTVDAFAAVSRGEVDDAMHDVLAARPASTEPRIAGNLRRRVQVSAAGAAIGLGAVSIFPLLVHASEQNTRQGANDSMLLGNLVLLDTVLIGVVLPIALAALVRAVTTRHRLRTAVLVPARVERIAPCARSTRLVARYRLPSGAEHVVLLRIAADADVAPGERWATVRRCGELLVDDHRRPGAAVTGPGAPGRIVTPKVPIRAWWWDRRLERAGHTPPHRNGTAERAAVPDARGPTGEAVCPRAITEAAIPGLLDRSRRITKAAMIGCLLAIVVYSAALARNVRDADLIWTHGVAVTATIVEIDGARPATAQYTINGHSGRVDVPADRNLQVGDRLTIHALPDASLINVPGNDQLVGAWASRIMFAAGWAGFLLGLTALSRWRADRRHRLSLERFPFIPGRATVAMPAASRRKYWLAELEGVEGPLIRRLVPGPGVSWICALDNVDGLFTVGLPDEATTAWIPGIGLLGVMRPRWAIRRWRWRRRLDFWSGRARP